MPKSSKRLESNQQPSKVVRNNNSDIFLKENYGKFLEKYVKQQKTKHFFVTENELKKNKTYIKRDSLPKHRLLKKIVSDDKELFFVSPEDIKKHQKKVRNNTEEKCPEVKRKEKPKVKEKEEINFTKKVENELKSYFFGFKRIVNNAFFDVFKMEDEPEQKIVKHRKNPVDKHVRGKTGKKRKKHKKENDINLILARNDNQLNCDRINSIDNRLIFMMNNDINNSPHLTLTKAQKHKLCRETFDIVEIPPVLQQIDLVEHKKNSPRFREYYNNKNPNFYKNNNLKKCLSDSSKVYSIKSEECSLKKSKIPIYNKTRPTQDLQKIITTQDLQKIDCKSTSTNTDDRKLGSDNEIKITINLSDQSQQYLRRNSPISRLKRIQNKSTDTKEITENTEDKVNNLRRSKTTLAISCHKLKPKRSKSDTKLKEAKKTKTLKSQHLKKLKSDSNLSEFSSVSAKKKAADSLKQDSSNDVKLNSFERRKKYGNFVRKGLINKYESKIIQPPQQSVEIRFMIVDEKKGKNDVQEVQYSEPSKKHRKLLMKGCKEKRNYKLNVLDKEVEHLTVISHDKFDKLYEKSDNESLHDILNENLEFLAKNFSYNRSKWYDLSGADYVDDIKCDSDSLSELYRNNKFLEESCNGTTTTTIDSQEKIVDFCSALGSEESGFGTLKSRDLSIPSFFQKPAIKKLMKPQTEQIFNVKSQFSAKTSESKVKSCDLHRLNVEIEHENFKSQQKTTKCQPKHRKYDIDSNSTKYESKNSFRPKTSKYKPKIVNLNAKSTKFKSEDNFSTKSELKYAKIKLDEKLQAVVDKLEPIAITHTPFSRCESVSKVEQEEIKLGSLRKVDSESKNDSNSQNEKCDVKVELRDLQCILEDADCRFTPKFCQRESALNDINFDDTGVKLIPRDYKFALKDYDFELRDIKIEPKDVLEETNTEKPLENKAKETEIINNSSKNVGIFKRIKKMFHRKKIKKTN